MKRYLSKIRTITISFLFLLLCTVVFSQQAHAAAYGVGSYGCGKYGVGCSPTPIPADNSNNSNNSNNSSGNGSSSSNSGSCSNQAPTSTPDLFQVNTTGTKATLYFAPAGMPYDNYVIRFGPTANNLLYSAAFSRGFAGGVIYYTVNELNLNTTYYFQVRAGNGCMPGNWGNIVSARTTGSIKSTAIYYRSLGGFVKSLVNTFTPKYTGPALPATGYNPQGIPVQQKANNNTIQPVQQINQAPVPTVAPKKKTCFFFICW